MKLLEHCALILAAERKSSWGEKKSEKWPSSPLYLFCFRKDQMSTAVLMWKAPCAKCHQCFNERRTVLRRWGSSHFCTAKVKTLSKNVWNRGLFFLQNGRFSALQKPPQISQSTLQFILAKSERIIVGLLKPLYVFKMMHLSFQYWIKKIIHVAHLGFYTFSFAH